MPQKSSIPPVSLKRRQLVRGAAWAAPVVIATSALPAYAASPCKERTQTFTWSSFTSGSDTLSSPATSTSTTPEVSVVRTTNSGTMLDTNFKVATGTSQKAYGMTGRDGSETVGTYTQGKGFNVNSAYTSSSLVLNQASKSVQEHARQTLTFTVPATVTTVLMPIFDVTSNVSASGVKKTYGDGITVSGATIKSLTYGSDSAPTGHLEQTGNTGFHSKYVLNSTAYQSNDTKATTALVTLDLGDASKTASTKTFTITYSNYLGDINYASKGLRANSNYQYIALGDFTLTYCE